MKPPNPRAERGGIGCAKHPDEPGPNCRSCGTNARAVNRRAQIVAVPDWCGECDPDTRLVEVPDRDALARCPRCHPSTAVSA